MIEDLIEESLSGTNYDISLVVHYLLKDHHICGSIKNKQWYSFDGNKWHLTEAGPYSELSTIVFNEYKKYLHDFEETDKRESILNVMNKLKNVTSKETINRECLYTFYDPEFLNKLDINDSIIGFINGVYEIDTNTFRTGTKNDMISIFIDKPFDECSDSLTNIIPRFIEYKNKIILKRKSIRNTFII